MASHSDLWLQSQQVSEVSGAEGVCGSAGRLAWQAK